ncbi:MAG TPA: hypothetical protein O0X70_07045 [Methanocorpusculum sp.]|nr:hypothetical protein [Methanocorpusculum sp.]
MKHSLCIAAAGSVLIIAFTVVSLLFSANAVFALQEIFLPLVSAAVFILAVVLAFKYKTRPAIAFALALGCNFLGCVYGSLHYFVRGSILTWHFTISNVSYVGLFLFLAAYSASLLYENLSRESRTNAKTYLIPSLGTAVLCAVCVFCLVSGYSSEISIIIYGISMMLALWFALRVMCFAQFRKANGFFTGVLIAHLITTLLWQFPFIRVEGFGMIFTSAATVCVFLFYLPVMEHIALAPAEDEI